MGRSMNDGHLPQIERFTVYRLLVRHLPRRGRSASGFKVHETIQAKREGSNSENIVNG